MDDGHSQAVLLDEWRKAAFAFEDNLRRVVLGQSNAIRSITTAVFARGHVLLAGDVGVGKTVLLRASARALGGAYDRIEGTVDMMPSDILYHTYLADDGRPRVEPSPLLAKADDLSVFFFNEINRARPQVHSLLLGLMAERRVSAFGRAYEFPHMQVFADRNRLEKEETFELPAAARDRFFMEVSIETPQEIEARRALIFDPRFHDADILIGSVGEPVLDFRGLNTIADVIQRHVSASAAVQDYVVRLWDATLKPAAAGISIRSVDMDRLVQGGASPRGLAFLVRAARVRAWLEGRNILVPEDIRAVFVETMAHRIFIDPIYDLRRDQIVRELCSAILALVSAP
ncbi:AAA family ATPase [Labrys sp. WJW]|uniref:AAA family ATPase n=1 Tax=Labrys sp. WJW TaxID=1737983 RepID=UPI00082B6C28|nr:MoxR family ATPase [Labrys sp. WJW]OCC05472.1 AAA family ATPase [Labrys sp. WJW]